MIETAQRPKIYNSSRHFYLLHLVIPAAAASLILWVIYILGIDERITRLFFNPETRRFPLRDNWFLETVMHHWIKYAVILLGLSVLVAYVSSFWVAMLAPLRRVLVFVVLAMALSTATVNLLKNESPKHCPYDLKIFGGYAPYVALFEKTPRGVKSGNCWPGAHSTAGFCLMALYFAGRHLRNRKLANWGLFGGLGLGFILGFGRVMQGAHFFSHQLWAALICWLVMLAVYELLLRRHSVPEKEAAFQPG
ncbi:MAG TPA: phosphatase PAP2 family protein [Burkholderiales bacterium]|nr:phosphatase PAP2 family protein [Burkholderiales bacterium]